ncbi:MAG: hypothetical protein ACFE9Z_06730 [Promethearchaeota archaeon]
MKDFKIKIKAIILIIIVLVSMCFTISHITRLDLTEKRDVIEEEQKPKTSNVDPWNFEILNDETITDGYCGIRVNAYLKSPDTTWKYVGVFVYTMEGEALYIYWNSIWKQSDWNVWGEWFHYTIELEDDLFYDSYSNNPPWTCNLRVEIGWTDLWHPTEQRESQSATITVTDDDPNAPNYNGLNVKFRYDEEYRDVNEKVYIFKDKNNNPIPECDQNLKIQLNYYDSSGIRTYLRRYRFLDGNGNVLYNLPEIFWDLLKLYPYNGELPSSIRKVWGDGTLTKTDILTIPADDWIISFWGNYHTMKGWKSYLKHGLSVIEVSSNFEDYDNDRDNDRLWSGWSEWTTVARIIGEEVVTDGFDMEFEYPDDPSLLNPLITYQPYKGEDVAFMVKIVNGLGEKITIDCISYATEIVNSNGIKNYVDQTFPPNEFFIEDHNFEWSTPFLSAELLSQFQDVYGDYLVYITIDLTLEHQKKMQVNATATFSVIKPEKPEIQFCFKNVKENPIEEKIALLMYYKYSRTRYTKIDWSINVYNRARLSLKLTQNLQFNIDHTEGRNPNRLNFDGLNNLNVMVGPCQEKEYLNSFSINDDPVFPPDWDPIGSILLDIFDWVGFADSVITLGKALHDIEGFIEGIGSGFGKVISGVTLIFDVYGLIKDVVDIFYIQENFDVYNFYEVDFLTDGNPFYCNFYDDINSAPIFQNEYKDIIDEKNLDFSIFTTVSAQQLADISEFWLLHAYLIGWDIASVVCGVIGTVGGPYGAVIGAIGGIVSFIGSYVVKEERDYARRRCDDPDPPAGDYTQPVTREFYEIALPKEYEENSRYSLNIYLVLQSYANLTIEREAQLEIIRRMYAAEQDGEYNWQLFQMEDLIESREREEEFFDNFINYIKELNFLFAEDFEEFDLTNQDFLDIESEVEANGISLEVQEIIGVTDPERLEEIEENVKSISESNLFNLENPNENSFLNYYKELNIETEELTQISNNAYEDELQNLNTNYVDVLILNGSIPIDLEESDLENLENLQQELDEYIDLKHWSNVIHASNNLIDLTNELMIKISNHSHPILLSYYNYAQIKKLEAIDNNNKFVLISSTVFSGIQILEPNKEKITKIYLELHNSTTPSTIALNVADFSGTSRFLNESGHEITQIILNPDEIQTVYLEYSFHTPDNYGIYALNVIFKESDRDVTLYRDVLVQLVEDDDITSPYISIDYKDGDKTDGLPGKWDIFAYDRESGINENTLKIYIDDILVGHSLGHYSVPNEIGAHVIRVEIWNNDTTTPEFAWSVDSVNIIDDDTSYPEISYVYTGDGTDGNSGEIIITAWDESGLSVDPSGIYVVSNSLGTHNFEFHAIDNDTDRAYDTLTSILSISITIEDDDIDPPEAVITYIGEGFDNNPGYFEWNVWDDDSGLNEIEIRVTYNSTDGSEDYEIFFQGSPTGKWDIPSNLGSYKLAIFARDNDDDRTLLIDSLTIEISDYQEIIDDDVDPPSLSNLVIIPDVFEINISLDAIDLSGIGEIIIYVNGEVIEPISFIKQEDTYTFIIHNNWLFKKGYSQLEIHVYDADDDRFNDSLVTIISGSFKNVLFDMYEHVDWQLEELKSYINENLSYRKGRCLIWKLSKAQQYLTEAFKFIEMGMVTCALYHDKIAKCFVQIVALRVEIYNKHCRLSDDHAEYIIDALQTIRDNIVIIMGVSTGLENAIDIAYLEVELLDLGDDIEEELPNCLGKYLSRRVHCASKMLEIALFMMVKDKGSECLLKYTQWKLKQVIWKIGFYLNKGRISEDLANFLIENITRIIDGIDQIIKTTL